jgi:hypothetical protein
MSSRPRRLALLLVIAVLVPLAAQGMTFTVKSSADSGGTCPGATCTLRQAILTAGSGDTINFDSSLTTIDLTTAELLINKNLTISGPGAASLKIRKATSVGSDPAFRVLRIASGNFNVTISGVTIASGFRQGISGADDGGGILVEGGNSLLIADCLISGNRSGHNGGGIANYGTVTVSDSTISDNQAGYQVVGGGGIYNVGEITITRSTLSGNTTSHAKGGGIHNSGTATITNSTIFGNVANYGSGGGISNDSTLTITNCTLSGNSTFLGTGGGIVNSGAVTITNSTVVHNGNHANNPNHGDGIYNSGTVNAKNTIVAANLELLGRGQQDFIGPLTSQGYNLIGNGNNATITPAQSTDQIGTPSSPIDPVLGPLQDNGGPTFTHALLSGSPATDKGHFSGSNTDQRGFARPVDNPTIANAAGGDGSDIGAFEKQEASIARSSNFSTRARVLSGDNVMIGGFIITGNVPKPVVLRGLGPSLTNSGVPAGEVLNDPVLELRGAQGALLISNDNWKDSPQRSEIEGTVFEPADDREAVIRTTLPPERFTAVLRGKDGGIGVGVVEIYDLDLGSDSTLANISSRAFVDTGNNVLIGGFILGGGNGNPTIVIRAIGPSLANFGFANSLPDPTLELRDANATLLAFNDDWQDDAAQASYIAAIKLQPADDLESAIAATLPPGAYTAIITGKSGGTGVALVEVYNLQ